MNSGPVSGIVDPFVTAHGRDTLIRSRLATCRRRAGDFLEANSGTEGQTPLQAGGSDRFPPRPVPPGERREERGKRGETQPAGDDRQHRDGSERDGSSGGRRGGSGGATEPSTVSTVRGAVAGNVCPGQSAVGSRLRARCPVSAPVDTARGGLPPPAGPAPGTTQQITQVHAGRSSQRTADGAANGRLRLPGGRSLFVSRSLYAASSMAAYNGLLEVAHFRTCKPL